MCGSRNNLQTRLAAAEAQLSYITGHPPAFNPHAAGGCGRKRQMRQRLMEVEMLLAQHQAGASSMPMAGARSAAPLVVHSQPCRGCGCRQRCNHGGGPFVAIFRGAKYLYDSYQDSQERKKLAEKDDARDKPVDAERAVAGASRSRSPSPSRSQSPTRRMSMPPRYESVVGAHNTYVDEKAGF